MLQSLFYRFAGSVRGYITPHVLQHSFASIGNDLGLTEATIATLVGHSRGTVTSRYIHTVDTALIMATHSIAGYIQGLLDGVAITRTVFALDREPSRSLGQTSPAECGVSQAVA